MAANLADADGPVTTATPAATPFGSLLRRMRPTRTPCDSYRLLRREEPAADRATARAELGDDAYEGAGALGRSLPPDGLGDVVARRPGRLRLVEQPRPVS